MTTYSGRDAHSTFHECLVGLPLLLCLALAGARGWAAGKGHGVEALLVSGELVQARPGEVVTLSLRITNTSQTGEEFIESLALPTGWQAITPLGVVTLGPNESQIRLFGVPVPRSAPAGRYSVVYSVQSQRDYGLRDESAVTIDVPALGQLRLLIDEKPEFVIAGDEYQVRMRVVNRGNSEAKAKLLVRSDEGCPATIDPAEVSLAPAASQTATITLQTSKQERQPRQNALQIQAISEDSLASTGLTVCVDIIPRVTAPTDLKRRLPVSLTLRTVGDAGRVGAQVEVCGGGPLDDARTRQISFLFRGPDTQPDSIFGLHDEYWIDYTSPRLDVMLGDEAYGLSALTDLASYGRGVSVDLRPANGRRAPEIGAYYVRSRWEQPARDEVGAHFTYEPNPRMAVTVNLLSGDREALGDEGLRSRRVWSVEAESQPLRGANLTLEYAASETGGRKDLQGSAYRIAADTRLGGGGHLSFTRTHADPEFAGYYSDCDYDHAALSVPLGRQLTARAFAGRWSQNLEQRPELAAAPRESLYEAGLDYAWPSGWRLGLGYSRFAHRDLLAVPRTDYTEQSLALSAGYSSQRTSWNCELRGGQQSAGPTGSDSFGVRCSLQGTYRPSDALAVSLSGSLGNGQNAAYSRLLDSTNSVGVSAYWKPSRSTALQASYLRNDAPAPWRGSDQIDLRAVRSLGDGRRCELRVLRASPRLGNDSGIGYLLSYTVPLGVPIGKRTDIGRVRGRVCDAQNPDRPGIPAVIVRSGRAVAVTDATGRFTFPALTPGRHHITVDRKSIGLTRVTQERLPLLVEVEGGEAQDVQIGVLPAATVSGTVVQAPAPENGTVSSATESKPGRTLRDATGTYVVGGPGQPDPSPESLGLANVLVELTDGTEVRRATTDSHGAFVFDGLRPGEWHLKVCDDNLPDYHYLDRAEVDVDLACGQQVEVGVKALPRLRRIRMVDLNATASLPDGELTAPQP
ncbi:MAG: hypothetical protein FJX75_19985 [Armatimonadetes bacterium]|nr:hypothetical protein [Armatimonadota bacterium]